MCGPRSRWASTTSRCPGADATTNAIIQADTLGILARDGVDLATRWPMGYDGNLIADAFKMYRDYDGAHAMFGDVWIHSRSDHQPAGGTPISSGVSGGVLALALALAPRGDDGPGYWACNQASTASTRR